MEEHVLEYYYIYLYLYNYITYCWYAEFIKNDNFSQTTQHIYISVV